MKEELNTSLNDSITSQMNGENGIVSKRGLIDDKAVLLKQIASLYLNENTSDIRLRCEGQVLPAHKCIVANQSQYFFKQIYGDSDDSNQPSNGGDFEMVSKSGCLDIFDTTAAALKLVLKYLYCGQLLVNDLELEPVIDVLTLSHRCKLNQVVSGISDYLKDIITIDNVWKIYNASNLFDERNSLAEFCLRFMDRSAVKLLHHDLTFVQSVTNFKLLITRKTFDAPEVEKFKAVYRWINKNPQLDSKDLVSCISLAKLAQEELLQIVRPTHLVSDSEILDAIQPKRKRVSIDTSTNTEVTKMEAIEFTPKFTIKTVKHETESVCYYYAVDFPEAYDINHIKLRLSELITGKGEYSYFIEGSTDKEKWFKIIDYSKYICRSWQNLYFDTISVKYLKIMGTRLDGKIADVIIDSFDCKYTHNPLKQENGLVIPNEDIASLDYGTRIRFSFDYLFQSLPKILILIFFQIFN